MAGLCLSTSKAAQLTALYLAANFAFPSIMANHHMNHPPYPNPDHLHSRSSNEVPLIVTNNCAETIYPGILSASGTGPGTGGFELAAGTGKTLSVSENWQGRVWGRTNCSFNSAGTGSASGSGPACSTGDCGAVDCVGTGQVPTSLAEFTLDAGDGQTYYDLSLVDGYNLPIAIVLHSNSNASFDAIPPNLTNPSCVGSVGNLEPINFSPYANGAETFLGTNSTDPLPFEHTVTSAAVAQWCPWDLQVSSSTGPAGGVYIYPDGSLDRPEFDPCYSACAKYNDPADCCTGSYDSPSSCSPSSYSKAAKTVCPDAYSYAFDDQTSTFIIPAGAGFEVVFCPGARSTTILSTSKSQLSHFTQRTLTMRRDISHDGVDIIAYHAWLAEADADHIVGNKSGIRVSGLAQGNESGASRTLEGVWLPLIAVTTVLGCLATGWSLV